MPTVETPSGALERPILLTSSTMRAAPSSASLRRGIGVEPAWLSKPVSVISYQRWPWPWVTTPTSIILVLEDRALLDVQLERGVDRPAADRLLALEADALEFVAERLCRRRRPASRRIPCV